MSDRPNLSVVLLNYNHGRFIAEAFSALADALGPNDELIVIDDASRDDSLRVIESQRPLYPSFRLVVHERNQGVIAGMNEGLRLASHRYVYFAAADDRVDRDLFTKSMSLLAIHPAAALCTARARVMDKDGHDLGLLKTGIVRSTPGYLTGREAAQALYRDDNWLVGCSTIYRCDALIANGGFRAELSSFCDGFASRLLACQHGACFLPDALSTWRKMSEGYSQSEASDLARVDHIAATAMTLFRESYTEVFVPGYPERWKQRWRFGALAHALRSSRTRLLTELKERTPARLRFLLPAITAAIAFAWAIRLLFLFVRMRPFDLIPTLQRRIGYLLAIRLGK